MQKRALLPLLLQPLFKDTTGNGFPFPPYVMPVTQAGFRGQVHEPHGREPVGVQAPPGEQHCTEQDAATSERKGARGDERGCPVNPVGAWWEAAAEWAILVRRGQGNSGALL